METILFTNHAHFFKIWCFSSNTVIVLSFQHRASRSLRLTDALPLRASLIPWISSHRIFFVLKNCMASCLKVHKEKESAITKCECRISYGYCSRRPWLGDNRNIFFPQLQYGSFVFIVSIKSIWFLPCTSNGVCAYSAVWWNVPLFYCQLITLFTKHA